MLALYHNDMSLCAQKVRLCLAEKQLDWEDRHIVLRSGEHQKPWYRQLNRRAVVPTLIHDASAAIISFAIAFRHQYLEKGELGKQMLNSIPNIFKRERRADVIAKGTESQHFMIAVQRMVQLLDEMEESLSTQEWLAGSSYTLADVAFTPYLARLEHLNILDMVGERTSVSKWHGRCKSRPSFAAAITKWENPDYLTLMQRRGTEYRSKVQQIIQILQ